MKRAWLYVVVIGVLIQTLALAQQPGNDSSTLKIENGSIANGVYTNECLGFSLPIPSGWEVSSEIVGTEVKASYIPGGFALLVLDRRKGNSSGSTIALLANEATAGTAQDFVSSYVHSQIKMHRESHELVRDAFAVDYGGNHFFRADYKQSPNKRGKTSYTAPVYAKFRGYFVGETIMAGSAQELNQAADSLSRISFREDQINPMCLVTRSRSKKDVRVTEAISIGSLIKRVTPEYPKNARKAHIQGQVVLQAEISKSGDIQNLSLVSGDPMLVPAAIEAVKQWKYKPYMLYGQSVVVETQVVVDFALNER